MTRALKRARRVEQGYAGRDLIIRGHTRSKNDKTLSRLELDVAPTPALHLPGSPETILHRFAAISEPFREKSGLERGGAFARPRAELARI